VTEPTVHSGRSEISAHFTGLADAYLRYWAPVLLPANEQLLRRLPMSAARAVLDVGAGVGSLHDPLRSAAPTARVVLCDRSLGMISCAPARAERVVADADQLPFGGATFDVVTLAFMLQYVDVPARTLREAARVLRPGGSLGALVWGRMQTSPAAAVVAEELDAVGAPPAPAFATSYDALDTPAKLSSAAADAGLVDAQVWQVPWVDQPDRDTYLRRQQRMGASGRRYALMGAEQQHAFVARVAPRLADLPDDAFRDASEVLALVARVP
jgi:SAM-dependent methyltransferase